MFAMLGDVRFELLSGFTAFDETHTASYAKHDVLAGRPRLQAMGNDLTSIRFSIKLHWKLGNPDTQYKGLIAAKEAQQALALVYGSGRHMGWYVIESLNSRTLIQDAKGRTSAREIDVDLTEFVGDPNNPIETPGILSGQNPLLSLLPESLQGPVSKIADAVEKGMQIYTAVEQGVGDIQNLINTAKELKNNPSALLGLVGDALAIGGASLDNLGALPEIGDWFEKLSGASDFLDWTGQAARQLQSGIDILQGGFDSGGGWGDWLSTGFNLVSTAQDSLSSAGHAAQSLTAWLATRKDGE